MSRLVQKSNHGGGHATIAIHERRGNPEHDRDFALAAAANRLARKNMTKRAIAARNAGVPQDGSRPASSSAQVFYFTKDLLRGLSVGGSFSVLTPKQRQALLNILGLEALPPLPEAPPPSSTHGYDPRSLPKKPPKREEEEDS
jgi:hypothetical protein